MEICEKVDIGVVDIKVLEGIEEFGEKVCESIGNRVVYFFKMVGKSN